MFKIPVITRNLLIINFIAFIAMYVLGGLGIDLTAICGLHFFMSSDFHLYQIITYMFMHANFTHIFFNMFMLWMFGVVVERVWGPRKFLFYYLSCGIGAGLFQELAQFIQFYVISSDAGFTFTQLHQVALANNVALSNWTTVGASGAIYSLLLAFGMMFPNAMIYFYFLIPIKAKWFVIGYAVIELITGLTGVDNVAHFAHLGGMLFGLFLILYWKKNPAGPNKNFRKLKDIFQSWKKRSGMKYTRYEEVYEKAPRSDEEYNYKKAQKEKDIDAILDKVAKNGYSSLTDEEKEFLFKNSK